MQVGSLEEQNLVEGFGYPYWAGYQLLVVIILLSVLRARMINTYQNIRQEADIQWKFFRANLWWNYLGSTLLPPPFTLTDALVKLTDWLFGNYTDLRRKRRSSQRTVVAREESRRRKTNKSRHLKYQELLFVLLSEIGEWKEDELSVKEKLENFDSVRIEVAFD